MEMIRAKDAVTTMFTVADTAPTALTSTVSMLLVILCSSCSQSMPSSQCINQSMLVSCALR